MRYVNVLAAAPAAPVSVELIDVVLTAAVLLTIVMTVFVSSRRSQAFSFLSMGVVMTLIWLRLGAVDIALAEAALGTGLLSALLVWLAVYRAPPSGQGDDEQSIRPAPRWLNAALGVVVGALVVVVLAAVWLRVEQRLPTWEQPLIEQLPATGAEHGVTGVLLAFRAYDTLLESAVLMLAGVVVLALGRGPGQSLGYTGGRVPVVPGPLRWLVRLAAPVLLLFGLWLMFAGSSDFGGAFQSGAVLAGMLILLRAGQVEMKVFNDRVAPVILVLGVVVFIAFAALGPLLGMVWLSWDPGWAFAAVLTIEIFLTAGIAVGLYVLFLGLESPVREGQEVVR